MSQHGKPLVEVVLPAQVYEAYDENGGLLYVGVATSLASRLSSHRIDKPWWGEVSRVTSSTHPTRAAALEAEKAMIRERHPKYNISYSEVNERAASARRQPLGEGNRDGDYKATVTREGKWWMVAIPELDGLTQARRLGEADLMAREWIAVTKDVPIEEIAVEVTVERVADIHVGDMVIEIKQTRADAAALEAAARSQAEDLARRLAEADIPVRDIGTIMGVSFQRAHQLVTADSKGT